MEKDDVIMKPVEVAEYLKIPVSTLYKLCQEGKIPAMRVGKHWRFRKEQINRWLDENLVSGGRE